MNTVEDIRAQFKELKAWNDIRPNGTIEIQGAQFIADEPTFFGEKNEAYEKAELDWYASKDRRVKTLFELYGKEVKVWKDIANQHGEVNSNYGWCIYSRFRGHQFQNAVKAIDKDKWTRQAVMIYTTPEMHAIAGKDFTCTHSVNYIVRRGFIDAHVYMRSSDIIYGYPYDLSWQLRVLWDLVNELNTLGHHYRPGNVIWNATSLHIYQRHFHLIEE